ncbi:unnamed protein product [Spirodela intermedia]|uniref:non-specific serine/threonine protein kinase n=1 Tax=Spirodela intermedia TaxID=51605 RepID=A0A7I8IYT7_SPIIN|nr:unnamed protein product [Spirodela intermedia]CAA6663156.1 unnamed protein product [Spirodela intermedia]
MSGMAPATARTRVGPYELGRRWGRGRSARSSSLTTPAPETSSPLRSSTRTKSSATKWSNREISTMKLIKHPNVVNIYEVMGRKTKVYIVLEFVDGGELFDKIAKLGRLKEDEARRYFQQLINAVDYCHSRGVYHRDLKPENLLLDSHDVLKVSDFGLSAFCPKMNEDGLLHTTCGTPNYVAPEVLDNKGYGGAAADVWSCGVILFVLMAGYLPFDEPNLMALYKKFSIFIAFFHLFLHWIYRADFTCPPWFSSGSMKLIKSILNPNPLTNKISEILENEWFKKGYKSPDFEKGKEVSLDDVDAVFNDSEEHFVMEKREKPESLNAFGLISKSQVFNLGKLFENDAAAIKRETRFTSRCSPNEILSKIEEAARPLGFNVRQHNYKMRLQGDKTGRKGCVSVATEVFEVAPSLHMVEVRKTAGDTLEFHKFYKSFSSGLKDIVWKSEANAEEEKRG